MENRILIVSILVAAMLLVVPSAALAWDDTEGMLAHTKINQLAYDNFLTNEVARDPTLANVTFSDILVPGESINVRGDWEVPEEAETMSMKSWIGKGGFTADEPEYPSALMHFYDPNNKATP